MAQPVVDSLSVDSIEGHNQVSGKGFPTTGPRIEAGSIVIHRGLHVSNVTASCSLCAIGCKELFTVRHRCPNVLYIVVMLMGYVVKLNCMSMDLKVLRLEYHDDELDTHVPTEGVSFGITRLICASFGITRLICESFGITRLICASFEITRLICASFEITRLIGASFGITRLIGVSFGVTRLIRASFRITRLMCKGTARGRPTRGKKDAWRPYERVCWYQSLSFRFCRLTYDVSLCFVSLWLKRSLPLVREMPPTRGARRGSRGGRGRGAGRVQPEVQPVAQAIDPAAPVTHADITAVEQRFRDLIMQMGEQQQPARQLLLQPLLQFQLCPRSCRISCRHRPST
ncbi:gag protease polyprotein [Cucumis melo var. makuwa]|uniref:Gag protease polyprotein n=1 Tax=Cucumis melo var. makuwa TaxID=1194695 RepID=A0A5D3D535_CUCMM|nr:gag protease polyprotein [Cucumis melo var. makuwa]